MTTIASAVRTAIYQSQTENRIVHLDYSAEAHAVLLAACEDWTDAGHGAEEFWGGAGPQSEVDGSVYLGDWRVHLDR